MQHMITNEEAYTFDNTTGAISRRENYEGVNTLFVLPLDKDLADPEAAEEYLSALEPDEESEDGYAAWSMEADAFMLEITPENIEQYADRIEESIHVFSAPKRTRYGMTIQCRMQSRSEDL